MPIPPLVSFFRFSGLSDLVEERRSRLQASQDVHQFFRDVEDESQWIREHVVVAASPDVGSSLTSVQNLQKRHNVRMACLCLSAFILIIKI